MLALLVVLAATVGPGSAVPPEECSSYDICEVRELIMKFDRAILSANLVDKIVFHAKKTSGLCPHVVTKVPGEGGLEMNEYGVFQLVGELVCKEGVKETKNVCNLDCSELTSSIEKEIQCLYDLIRFARAHVSTQDKGLRILLNRGLFFNTEVVPEGYFDFCKTRESSVSTLH